LLDGFAANPGPADALLGGSRCARSRDALTHVLRVKGAARTMPCLVWAASVPVDALLDGIA